LIPTIGPAIGRRGLGRIARPIEAHGSIPPVRPLRVAVPLRPAGGTLARSAAAFTPGATLDDHPQPAKYRKTDDRY
jgi:hypothetical protein